LVTYLVIEFFLLNSNNPSLDKPLIPTRDVTPTKSAKSTGGKVVTGRKGSKASHETSATMTASDKAAQPRRRQASPRVSASVERERQMTARREHLKEEFTLKREREAQSLLADIMLDNLLLQEQQSLRETRPLDSARTKLPKEVRRSEAVLVPGLELERLGEGGVKCSEMVVRNREPSAMARTIKGLERKEAVKHRETERLLKGIGICLK